MAPQYPIIVINVHLHLPDILMSNFSYSASSLIRDTTRHDSNTSHKSVLYYEDLIHQTLNQNLLLIVLTNF